MEAQLYFAYGACYKYTSSQSSIIITCFNHVAHKKFSKKVIGVIFYIPAEKIMH